MLPRCRCRSGLTAQGCSDHVEKPPRPPPAAGAGAGAASSFASFVSRMTPRATLHRFFVQHALPLCSGLNLPPVRQSHLVLISVMPQIEPSSSPGPCHGPPRLLMRRSPTVHAQLGC